VVSQRVGTLLVIEEMTMAAVETSSAQLATGFADAYQLARRSMFEAAARVLRYHATASELKRIRSMPAAVPQTTPSTSAEGTPGA
jgi:hypothetical protein